MSRVLLLEDDRSLRRLIADRLMQAGYEVEEFFDGAKALASLSRARYDLFILDIGVPGLNGYRFLKRVRDQGHRTPAIIVSAHGDMECLDEGYALGCDDFLRKPFGLKELIWRAEAHLQSGDTRIALNHPFSYCPVSSTLFRHNEAIALTPKERALIALLVARRSRPVSIEEILEQIWGEAGTPQKLRTLIHKLRQKGLEELIVGYKGVGYQIG